MKFNHIVCGGTFDHLHAGHKLLLQTCFKRGTRVSIGITNRAMTRHKPYSDTIESYVTRLKNIQLYVAQNKADATIIKLHDIYGSTLTDSTIDAIFVTSETLKGAEKINDERIKIGMKPLYIEVVPFINDDSGDKIASERIRQGFISREGISYGNYLISRGTLYMPKSLIGVLRKPLGRVISISEASKDSYMDRILKGAQMQSYITHTSIGDVVTYNLKKRGIDPALSIIDGKTQRKALKDMYLQEIMIKGCHKAINKKGTLDIDALNVLYSIFKSGHGRAMKQIFIDGEEDLLTLAVILLSPLKSHVWYGQSGKGAVDVIVTENKKQTVYNLLQQFVSEITHT